MLLKADGTQFAAWVVRDARNKTFSLAMVCEDEGAARALKGLAYTTDPNRAPLEVAPVLITVHEVLR